MDNYEFCAAWAAGQIASPSARILDYGCGAGRIVEILKLRGLAAFGTDVFYGGGDYSSDIDWNRFGDSIRRMDGSTIPFDDNYFDIVINNQVLEHVADLREVLQEIERVLKPGGKCLSLFPDRSVWREGHCGVPLMHRFPKGSRARVYYAAAFRLLGFGYHTAGKETLRWSREFCEWLDQWTYYRDINDIEAAFAGTIGAVHYIEEKWLGARAPARARWITFAPVPVQRWLVHKLAGLVIVSTKQAQPVGPA